MTTSVYPATGGFVDNTSAAVFIPEIWSDEVIAAYKANLVLANLARKMKFQGKKGDTIHVPKPIRGAATAKAANTAVTVQNETELELAIAIDQHWEYSRLIEDITETQAKSSLRKFYTDDAGFALATRVDTDLFALGKSFGDGDGSDWTNSAVFFNDATNGLTAFAEDTVIVTDYLTDAGVRGMIQKLDDNNVPMTGRFWAVPPSAKNTLLGIDRYVSSDFNKGMGVANGMIGSVYGVDFYTTTNAPIIETAANNTAGDDVKASMLAHRDAMILVEQVGVRSQAQYKQEWLGTLYTADQLYGKAAYRPEAGFIVAVPG